MKAQPTSKRASDEAIDRITSRAGVLDCLYDPYDALHNGDCKSSIAGDIRRIFRLAETTHGINNPESLAALPTPPAELPPLPPTAKDGYGADTQYYFTGAMMRDYALAAIAELSRPALPFHNAWLSTSAELKAVSYEMDVIYERYSGKENRLEREDLLNPLRLRCREIGERRQALVVYPEDDMDQVQAKGKKRYVWECNECGCQEYNMCVSEEDVNNLGCGGCGGDEWHRAEEK